MQKILFEERDLERAAEVTRFFERHLVSLSVRAPMTFDSDTAPYRAADAILLSLGADASEVARYVSYVCPQVTCPIIVVSDRVLSDIEALKILESGASDCLASPYCDRVLLARVRARVRRNIIVRARMRPQNYRFDKFGLDTQSRELLTARSSARLPRKECTLLMHFMLNNHAAITREELLEVVSAEDLDLSDRSIDSLVSRLRERLVAMGGRAEIIRTIRGFGYAFESTVEPIAGDEDLRALL